MNGKVYSGVLVQTETVAAADGVTTGVQKSTIVYAEGAPFVAPSSAAAAVILSSRAARKNPKLDFEDSQRPIEVQLSVLVPQSAIT